MNTLLITTTVEVLLGIRLLKSGIYYDYNELYTKNYACTDQQKCNEKFTKLIEIQKNNDPEESHLYSEE